MEAISSIDAEVSSIDAACSAAPFESRCDESCTCAAVPHTRLALSRSCSGRPTTVRFTLRTPASTHRGGRAQLLLTLANLLEAGLRAGRIGLRGGDHRLSQRGLQVRDEIPHGARLLDAERGAARELLDLDVHRAHAVEAVAAENQHRG